MIEPTIEQIRNFRLHSHHLDREYPEADVGELVGACGMQNTPPGAWETALYNRSAHWNLAEMENLLYEKKSLLQAWSLRGAPLVFPTSESDVFLSALVSQEGEGWIYTHGIGLALDFLQMDFDDLLAKLRQVMPQLAGHVIVSKTALDQTLAEWMLPLLPAEKQQLWNQPSMYGRPDIQTVGGAVVSFLLRPCAFEGLVVFGQRQGISPTFTSYKRWTGNNLHTGENEDAAKGLARKFLHCYGPAILDHFVNWLGCSRKQGRRIWETISAEIEPIRVFGKKAYILSADRERLFSACGLERELLLLGGHDPFLDQRDRVILQPDKALHKKIWTMVSNPGVIVYRGEAVGIWNSKKKSNGMEVKVNLWSEIDRKDDICELAEKYAAFRRQKLIDIQVESEKGIAR